MIRFWLIALAMVWTTPAQADDRQPGSAYMGEALRAMQQDDAANPASLWVAEGEALWQSPAGLHNLSCASCHGPLVSMGAVAATYPKTDKRGRRVLTLDQRIETCRVSRQQAQALGAESRALLGLSAALARQARGTAIAPMPDALLSKAVARGRHLYF